MSYFESDVTANNATTITWTVVIGNVTIILQIPFINMEFQHPSISLEKQESNILLEVMPI